MATKYLDSNGLAYFWGKIKAYGDAHWGGGAYVDMTTPMLNLDTTATSGTDKEIYDALVSLGWDSDVIV